MDYSLDFVKAIPIAFFALMPVVNPIGTAIILLGLTHSADDTTRKMLARKIAINSVVFLGVVLLAGGLVLSFFGISIPVVQVAGGLVLAAMGWELLNQKSPEPAKAETAVGRDDPSSYDSQIFYPFTFPITIGPGSVAVTLTLSAHTTHDTVLETVSHQLGTFVGILGTGLTVFLAIIYSGQLTKRLGPGGTAAMLRLIAFIVICIGAQIVWSGVDALISEIHQS